MPSDEELLRAFAKGERSALGALAERYERALLDLGVAILGSREWAVDAVQETWVRVIRYAGTFNGRSSVKTWLYRIAINQCRSVLAAGGPAGVEALHEREGGPSEPGEPAAMADDPADVAVRSDEAERLKQAVERLSPPLREAVLLCYMHGLTHEEAAEALGVPLGTVKSRVHAALEELRAKWRG